MQGAAPRSGAAADALASCVLCVSGVPVRDGRCLVRPPRRPSGVHRYGPCYPGSRSIATPPGVNHAAPLRGSSARGVGRWKSHVGASAWLLSRRRYHMGGSAWDVSRRRFYMYAPARLPPSPFPFPGGRKNYLRENSNYLREEIIFPRDNFPDLSPSSSNAPICKKS